MLKISKYKNLIQTVAITDFKLKYQGSVLGYLWSLLKPLLLFFVLYFVFTSVFNIKNTIPFYPVYLLTGIVVWSFFTETSITCLFAIVNKGDLIRKVYFPRITLILSNGLTSVLTFGANFVIIFVFMLFNSVPITWRVLFLPLIFIELAFFVLGVGLILSSLFVRFRDVGHIWEVFIQALFYATPILYSPEMVPDFARKIIMLNPMAQIIQDTRWALITSETVTAWDVLYVRYSWIPYVLSFVIFIVGYYTFEKMAARFAEDV